MLIAFICDKIVTISSSEKNLKKLKSISSKFNKKQYFQLAKS